MLSPARAAQPSSDVTSEVPDDHRSTRTRDLVAGGLVLRHRLRRCSARRSGAVGDAGGGVARLRRPGRHRGALHAPAAGRRPDRGTSRRTPAVDRHRMAPPAHPVLGHRGTERRLRAGRHGRRAGPRLRRRAGCGCFRAAGCRPLRRQRCGVPRALAADRPGAACRHPTATCPRPRRCPVVPGTAGRPDHQRPVRLR